VNRIVCFHELKIIEDFLKERISGHVCLLGKKDRKYRECWALDRFQYNL
jgi:hypothetical protein